jgi:GNAT superfamily N-acetyltransferase
VCSAVGFNTIPAWFRPYAALSTGEKFRVEMARRMIEGGNLIVMDEFTSVIDRQVAKIGAHAVQKYARRNGKKFVAVTCHYDIEEWLQPDWVFDVAAMQYRPRGALRRRPVVECEIRRVRHEAWRIFAPFHYLTAELHKAAACYGLFVDGRIVAFAGVLHRPNWRKSGQDIKGISRIVCLPDWQGMGLAPALAGHLGAAYKGIGWRLRSYPAHPALIRVADKSPDWSLIKKPGFVAKTNRDNINARTSKAMRSVSRPGAVFEYCGPAMDKKRAAALIEARPLEA